MILGTWAVLANLRPFYILHKGRPSPGRFDSRLPPYVGCNVYTSVCLPPGLSGKRPDHATEQMLL